MKIRPARDEDVDAVAAFTRDTWDRYENGDYMSKIFPTWAADESPGQQTFVAEREGTPIGLVRSVLLSDHEAWFQGLRVNPAHRNEGVGRDLIHAAFDWAQGAGATVGRAMVFSWNVMGLGLTRAAGFDPGVEFRWAHPEPDAGASIEDTTSASPNAAWSYWQQSGERETLAGLGLDDEVPWALSELTRADLAAAADTESLLAIERDRIVAMAPRVRVVERESEEGTPTWAEYGVAAWEDLAAAGDLMAAIARDAAEVGADKTRVLLPETSRAVTDVAAHRIDLAEEPDFVLRVDLTRSSWD